MFFNFLCIRVFGGVLFVSSNGHETNIHVVGHNCHVTGCPSYAKDDQRKVQELKRII